MRVIHSGSCNIHAGGPALSTWLTIKGLRKHGVEAELITRPLPPENIIDTELKPYFSKIRNSAHLPTYLDFRHHLTKSGKQIYTMCREFGCSMALRWPTMPENIAFHT